ncbi:MAG: prepilin-type N-terminal cleavage/methylation domain-containing protein [Desulfobacteraceae bacterium]|nr:prepilin-type N-terminal cleavage/methylation domain-containing protein [Desulfobacteraceae bacterium]
MKTSILTHSRRYAGSPINRNGQTAPDTAASGFTILELMVAIFIFAIVVSTVFGSFRSVFSSSEAMNTSTDLREMAANCLDRMRSDLLSIYVSVPPAYIPPEFNDDPDIFRVVGDVSDDGSGDYGRLTFTSTAHLPFRNDNRTGIAQIIYYADTDADDGIVIRRQDNLYPYPDDFEKKEGDPILCERVKGLTFTYYDHDNEETDRWNSESDENSFASPIAVKIALVLGDEDSEMALQTRINIPMHRPPVEK